MAISGRLPANHFHLYYTLFFEFSEVRTSGSHPLFLKTSRPKVQFDAFTKRKDESILKSVDLRLKETIAVRLLQKLNPLSQQPGI